MALYLVTLSPSAYPGESAGLLAAYTGASPFMPLTHPLWALLVSLVELLPFGTLALRANVVSALCGAGAVTLMYLIVSRIEHRRTFEESVARYRQPIVGQLSGLVAAALLAVATPMWIVSTRAHTASFNVLHLLFAFFLLQSFWRTKRVGFLFASVGVYGLGIPEFATFILLLPLYGIMVLYSLWKGELLQAKRVVQLVGLGLIGLSLYFIHSARFAGTEAYEWREFKSYWHVVLQMLKDQYKVIMYGVPKVGWLTISIVSFLPWLIVFFARVPRQGASDRNVSIGSYLLSFVVTALGVAIFANTLLSPWTITEGNPLLVTPYLFIATWMGYLAGYWLVIFSRDPRRDAPTARAVRRAFRLALAPLLVALVAFAGWRSFPVADGRPAGVIQGVVDGIVDELGDRSWLISNGVFDNEVQLAARERGHEVSILSVAPMGGASAYAKYVSSLFDDSRRQSLARVGIAPLLNDWFSSDTNVFRDVAVLTHADYWFASGGEPLPRRVLFAGLPDGGTVDLDAMLRDHQAMWDRLVPDLQRLSRSDNLLAPWCTWTLGHLAKVANNLGVFFEDQNRSDAAFTAYEQAMRIDTNNLSALLNAFDLSKREKRPELADLEKEVQLRAKRLQARFRVWSLSHFYGYVRRPETYASRGWAWAMTGKPNLALSDMRRALRVGEDRPQLQLAMANLYFAQEMDDQSEVSFLEVLKKDPSNRAAMLGLARVSTRKGNLDAARAYLQRLEEMNAPKNLLRMERAVVESVAGNLSAAMTYLREIVKDDPENMQAWAAIATLARDADDNAVLDEALTKLESARVLLPSVRLAVAKLALARNDRDAARRHLTEVIRYQPGHIEALELLLRLDVREGQRDLAERHVELLLGSDPKNALANYILGTLQVYREQYALAESSLRTSLATARTPDTLNDLAWVLHRRGAYDEALSLAKEALRADRNHRVAWDTLGVILLSKGDLDGAEKALQQAIALMPDAPEVLLHMTMLYEKKGQKAEALRLADSLLARPNELTRESYDQLRDIVKRLRGS